MAGIPAGEEQMAERPSQSQRQPGASPCCAVLNGPGRAARLEIEARRTVPAGLRAAGHDQRQLAGSKWAEREPDEPCSAAARPAWPGEGNLVRLTELQSPELSASGSLPLRWQKRRGPGGKATWTWPSRRPPFALQRLSPPASGLSSRRSRRQRSLPWSARRPAVLIVQLTLRQSPVAGRSRSRKPWRGSLHGQRRRGKQPAQNASPGPRHRQAKLRARLSANWLPQQGGAGATRKGQFATVGSPQRYQWVASVFPSTDRVEVGPRARPTPIGDGLSGQGQPRFPTRWRPAARLTLSVPMVLELLAGTHASGGSASGCSQLRVALSRGGRLVTYNHQWTDKMELFAPSWRVARLPLEMFSQLVGSWPLNPGGESAALGAGPEDLGQRC